MTKLFLNNKFKSLEPFQFDLPDFVVLTGVNGAGKTQILSAILANQISVMNDLDVRFQKIKLVTSETLSPNDSRVVTRIEQNRQIEQLWNGYSQSFIQQKLTNPHITVKSLFGENSPNYKIIHRISADSKKEIGELTANDFYNYFPLYDKSESTEVFYQNFSSLFKRFQDRWDENQYRRYRNEALDEKEVSFLTSEQFIQTHGEPPWDFVNRIIKEAKLDYHINSPVGNHRDAPFELKLINNHSDAEINFSDLSSGEKVLMSLALAIYNSNFDIDFPEILLMDEPDASLHPSMSKQFLEVVENVFVKEKNVKVILTTHSPSTVALSPEESIFVINKYGQPRIQKSTKDLALNILTAGVPSFSVNYENRRQIFVESPNDVIFFEKLYRVFSNYLHSEISLSFISSGESRTDANGVKVSNCEQVVNITNVLRNAGNKFVWGIIDWDLKESTGNDYVQILGGKKRYSIENYIFDPILLGTLLLRQKIVKKTEIGLLANETYIDIRNFESDKLQIIVDKVVNEVQKNVSDHNQDSQICKLINNQEVTIPNWYLHCQGHKLEEIILRTFPGLNELKRNKEEALKIEILDKIVDDLPGLVSQDVLNSFLSIQK